MRTTVAIPDDLYEAAEIFVGHRQATKPPAMRTDL